MNEFENFKQKRLPIGKGMSADIYKFDGFVYKCFDWHAEFFDDKFIEREYKNLVAVYGTGLTTPKPYESEFPRSIKMEFIDGQSFEEVYKQDSPKQRNDVIFKAFDDIHKIKNIDVCKMQNFMEDRIGFTVDNEELNSAHISFANECLTEVVEMSGNNTCLCHMDLKYSNFMHLPDCDYIIDWAECALGHPLWDFARTFINYNCDAPCSPYGDKNHELIVDFIERLETLPIFDSEIFWRCCYVIVSMPFFINAVADTDFWSILSKYKSDIVIPSIA